MSFMIWYQVEFAEVSGGGGLLVRGSVPHRPRTAVAGVQRRLRRLVHPRRRHHRDDGRGRGRRQLRDHPQRPPGRHAQAVAVDARQRRPGRHRAPGVLRRTRHEDPLGRRRPGHHTSTRDRTTTAASAPSSPDRRPPDSSCVHRCRRTPRTRRPPCSSSPRSSRRGCGWPPGRRSRERSAPTRRPRGRCWGPCRSSPRASRSSSGTAPSTWATQWVGEAGPVVFDPMSNIVRRVDRQDEEAPGRPPGATRQVSTTVALTALGHPDLRVGQVATVKNLDDVPSGPLRIARVVHRFATGGATGTNGAGTSSAAGSGAGYTCEVLLVAAPKGEPGADQWRRPGRRRPLEGRRGPARRRPPGGRRGGRHHLCRRRGRQAPGLGALRAGAGRRRRRAQRRQPGDDNGRAARQADRRTLRLPPLRSHDARLPQDARTAGAQPRSGQRRGRGGLAVERGAAAGATPQRAGRLVAGPTDRPRRRRPAEARG